MVASQQIILFIINVSSTCFVRFFCRPFFFFFFGLAFFPTIMACLLQIRLQKTFLIQLSSKPFFCWQSYFAGRWIVFLMHYYRKYQLFIEEYCSLILRIEFDICNVCFSFREKLIIYNKFFYCSINYIFEVLVQCWWFHTIAMQPWSP